MSNTIDQQFVEYVIKSLVSKPDAVVVERTIDEKGVLLTLTVDPEDLGRVIGKRGATAQSVRTLLRALGTKNEARYNLKIVDNGEPRPERQQKNEVKEKEESFKDAEDTPVESKEEEGVVSESAAATDDDSWTNSDDSDESEAKESKPASESALERTRRELDDLDDLEI